MAQRNRPTLRLCRQHQRSVESPPVLALSTVITHVECFGGTDGAINLSISGGTPQYAYLWSNGAVSQDINGLPAGIYIATVTDANACTAVVQAAGCKMGDNEFIECKC
ncbi:MAG: hypothetical protein DYG98_16260 [Haliscomenobacteraceae bacterium CHB4]|nr:hypothetical protein [Haliscomenobacteraceae bacterium CHB4]